MLMQSLCSGARFANEGGAPPVDGNHVPCHAFVECCHVPMLPSTSCISRGMDVVEGRMEYGCNPYEVVLCILWSHY